jgi:hypothetical protein
MEKETKEFIETWNARLERIKGDNLEDIFQRFEALYVLHNRLYNESFKILNDSGKLTKARYADYEMASIVVIEYLSADVLFNGLKENNNLEDIESVAKLIENKVFHINIANGVPQQEFDDLLLENLRSTDRNIFCKAVLMTIYNVRSNTVHGQKHFQEYQRLLLEPLTRILSTVTKLQIESQQ